MVIRVISAMVCVCALTALPGCRSITGETQKNTAASSSVQTVLTRDPDWELRFVSSVPTPRTSSDLSCTKDGFCWLRNAYGLWSFRNEKVGLQQILKVEPNQQDLLLNSYILSPEIGWVVKSSGLYRTGDGGRSWVRIAVSALDGKAGKIQAVYFQDDKHGWIAGGFYRERRKGEGTPNNAVSDDREHVLTGCILETSDSGETWKMKKFDELIGRFERILFSDDVGIAFGDAGIVMTTDGGNLWTKRLSEFQNKDTGEKPEAMDAFFLDDRNLWISLNGGRIISTQDAGQSWRLIYGPTESQPEVDPDTLAQMAFVNMTDGIALSRELGGGRLFKTKNGGKTWSEISAPEKLYALVLQKGDSHGAVIGQTSIYSIDASR